MKIIIVQLLSLAPVSVSQFFKRDHVVRKGLLPAHMALLLSLSPSLPTVGIFFPPKRHYFCANAIKAQWVPQAWQSRAEQRGSRNLRSCNNHSSLPPILTQRKGFLCFMPPTWTASSVSFKREESLLQQVKTTGLDLQNSSFSVLSVSKRSGLCVVLQNSSVVS